MEAVATSRNRYTKLVFKSLILFPSISYILVLCVCLLLCVYDLTLYLWKRDERVLLLYYLHVHEHGGVPSGSVIRDKEALTEYRQTSIPHLFHKLKEFYSPVIRQSLPSRASECRSILEPQELTLSSSSCWVFIWTAVFALKLCNDPLHIAFTLTSHPKCSDSIVDYLPHTSRLRCEFNCQHQRELHHHTNFL